MLDRVGMEKADSPVDSHKAHRQNGIVHQSEPKIDILIQVLVQIRPLASLQALLFLLPHIVSSEAVFKACQGLRQNYLS